MGYHKILTFKDIFLYGVASTLGAGVFATPALAAVSTGGSVCIAFILSGLITIITGLSYAELSGWMP